MHYPLSDEQSDRVVVGLENVHTFEELTVTEEGLMFLSGTISFSATTLELDQRMSAHTKRDRLLELHLKKNYSQNASVLKPKKKPAKRAFLQVQIS